MPEQQNRFPLRDEFSARLEEARTTRSFDRSCTVVETEVGGTRYIPLLRNPKLVRQDGTQEYELLGGKIDPRFVERLGEKFEVKPDLEYLKAEARREVLEEMPVYATATSLTVEPIQWDRTISTNHFFAFSKRKGDHSNLHVTSRVFLGSASFGTLPSHPETPEHSDMVWVIAPTWDDNTTAREQLQSLTVQLIDEGGLYALPVEAGEDVYQIVLNREQLKQLQESETPPTYLPLSKVSREALYQYFWHVGGYAKEDRSSV